MAMKLVKPKVKNVHWGIALLAAIVLDLLDFAGVGLIPGIGDVFDLIAIAILFKLIGPLALIGFAELIPVAVTDALPIFTVIVILAWLFKDKKVM